MQGQITSNQDAIKALQQLVGAGKWVTSITSIENGFTVTMSDGTTHQIKGINGKDGVNGQDGKDADVWKIGEDGYWYLNGDKTEFKAVGEKGDKGDKGDQGEKGEQGEKGDQGEVGPQGPAGQDGQDGAVGPQGPAGQNGQDGAVGPQGPAGQNGQDGKPGKDGVNGVDAKAPTIGENGNWLVWNWDAAQKKYVSTDTGISAKGTAAYAVEANGVITLHFTDPATGKQESIVLPTTSVTFVADAPASQVRVVYEYATFKNWEKSAKTAEGKELLKAFPELAELTNKSLLKQGGKLPVMINPANVELTNDFKFALYAADGAKYDVALTNPQKGLPVGMSVIDGIMKTRTNGNDCYWSLDVEPGIGDDKKPVSTEDANKKLHNAALVITNPLGTSVKTQFAYTLKSECYSDADNTEDDVKITTKDCTLNYATAINLFAVQKDNTDIEVQPIKLEREYEGKYIVVLNPLEAEKYGLSMSDDNKTLNIANMPANVTNLSLHINVIALGLNGSIDTTTGDEELVLTLSQEVPSGVVLANKEIVVDKNAVYVQWNIADLKLSEVNKEKIFKNSKGTVEATRTYVNPATGKPATETIKPDFKMYLPGDANKSTNDYTKADRFGFEVTADQVNGIYWHAPETYEVKFTFNDNQSPSTVVYSTNAKLTTSVPEQTLVNGLTLKNTLVDGAIQISGTVSGMTVTYDLTNEFTKGKNLSYATVKFVDLEHNEKAGKDTPEYVNWIDAANSYKLTINTWLEEDQFEVKDHTIQWYKSNRQQLNVERSIRANYYFFENPFFVGSKDFKVRVVSPLYREDWKEVVKLDDKKLSTWKGAAAKDQIDLSKAIVATHPGTKSALNLCFAEAGVKDVPTTYSNYQVVMSQGEEYDVQTNWNAPKLVDGKDGLPIVLSAKDLVNLGLTTEQYVKIDDTKKFFLYSAVKNIQYGANGGDTFDQFGWNDVWYAYQKYYEVKNGEWVRNEAELPADGTKEAKLLQFFKDHEKDILFKTVTVNVPTPVPAKNLGQDIASVSFKFDDLDHAAKYVVAAYNIQTSIAAGNNPVHDTLNGYKDGSWKNGSFTIVARNVNYPAEGVNVAMTMEITDKWGRRMTVPFTVHIAAEAPVK